jgi:hypothetical protein
MLSVIESHTPTTRELLERHVFEPHAREELATRFNMLDLKLASMAKIADIQRTAVQDRNRQIKRLKRQRLAWAIAFFGVTLFSVLRGI